jgi:hypothetical protein
MIKKLNTFMIIGAAALILSSCNTVAPLAVSSNPIGKKIGTASAKIIFGMNFGGDYGVQTASKNGGITNVSTVDVKTYNFLNVYIKKTVIVTGE